MKSERVLAAIAAVCAIAMSAGPGVANAGLFGPPKLPDPTSLMAPDPIAGATGKYMCPFTSDGVTAEWVTKAMKVKAGSQLGSLAGQYAGQEAMKQVPFVGGMLGGMVGNKIGHEVAMKAIGGEEFLHKTSDLSFNSIDDLSVFIYAKYSSTQDYPKILEATYSIYPEMRDEYMVALVKAGRNK